MNIRIEGVVHRPNEIRYLSNLTSCGVSFGPGIAIVEWTNLPGATLNRTAMVLPNVRIGDTYPNGVVVDIPPDGVTTNDEVTCMLCLVETVEP